MTTRWTDTAPKVPTEPSTRASRTSTCSLTGQWATRPAWNCCPTEAIHSRCTPTTVGIHVPPPPILHWYHFNVPYAALTSFQLPLCCIDIISTSPSYTATYPILQCNYFNVPHTAMYLFQRTLYCIDINSMSPILHSEQFNVSLTAFLSFQRPLYRIVIVSPTLYCVVIISASSILHCYHFNISYTAFLTFQRPLYRIVINSTPPIQHC